jgi:hypothetical protein
MAIIENPKIKLQNYAFAFSIIRVWNLVCLCEFVTPPNESIRTQRGASK